MRKCIFLFNTLHAPPAALEGCVLVLYALSLNTDTTVYDTQDYILRGYEHFTEKLNALGACVCEETHEHRKENI